MITLTKLNGDQFVINADLIERVEGGADTVVVLSNGHQYVVRDSRDAIVARVVAYRASVERLARSQDPLGQA